MRKDIALKLFAVAVLFGSVLYSRFALPQNRSLENLANENRRAPSISLYISPPAGVPLFFRPPPADPVADLFSIPSLPNLPSVTPPAAPLSASLPVVPSQKKALSETDIFQIQHPPYYLDYLERIEAFMIKDGLLEPEEKVQFDSEESVLGFWRNRGFDYMVAQGVVTEADRPRFNRGLALVRELHDNEAKLLRSGMSQIGVPPLAARLVNYIAARFSDFFAPTVFADCFTPGSPSGTLGTNLAAICCACHNVDGEPIGCLNRVCLGRPAIYDPTTFICGCG